jgi:hypothetical protein
MRTSRHRGNLLQCVPEMAIIRGKMLSLLFSWHSFDIPYVSPFPLPTSVQGFVVNLPNE